MPIKIFRGPGGYFHEIYLLEAFTPRTSNFERPFTPRTSLRSASNFGKTRFRRFATFDFSTPKKKFRRQKKIVEAHFFSRTAFFWRFGLAKVGIGTSVVQNHCLGCDFQVSTMLHRREPSTFVFCSLTLGEKNLHTRGGVQQKNCNFFFKNCFFLKIWPSKSGYRHVRRPKSLPRMRFSGLYDASPARTINFCVLLLDLGRKKTSIRGSTVW